jgi:hypothetical protein
MSARHPSPLALTLLDRFVVNEALKGDLVESAAGRSHAWFYHQVLFALLAQTISGVKAAPRVTAEAVLVATAMLALIGFNAVVVANLLSQLFLLNNAGWVLGSGRFVGWQIYATAPLFVIAVFSGRAIGGFHRQHRVWAILGCGLSASTAAFVNFYLFVPSVPLQPFIPSPAQQTAVALLFACGLFVGISSRSTCESLPSSSPAPRCLT